MLNNNLSTNNIKMNIIQFVYNLTSNIYFFIMKELEKEEKRIMDFYYDDDEHSSAPGHDLIFEAIKLSE